MIVDDVRNSTFLNIISGAILTKFVTWSSYIDGASVLLIVGSCYIKGI